MYTPPVPPVTMLSERPVKSGAPVALAAGVPPDPARDAWHAAARKRIAMASAGTRLTPFISPSVGRMLPPGPREAVRPPLLRGGHAATLLVGLRDDRRDARGLAVLVDRDVDEVRR